ncbi:MAG: hypothetical protein M1335_07670 [Chloroflexi bacterium]|nr:hypothetical protein [Chloroflexota bacterium]MCL5105251.1 hypothetical protein [Armatimonadota bacterium]
MAEKGKLSKTARASTHFGQGEAKAAVVENDSSRGKVFVEVKKLLMEASIGFQNLSSSHPIIVNKGSFDAAVTVVKGALVEGDSARYRVEKEEPGQAVLLENTPKEPGKVVIRESPFAWYA